MISGESKIRSIISAGIFLALLTVCQVSIAQSTGSSVATTGNPAKIVELDFNDPNKVPQFPFDEFFAVRLTNIPSTVTSVQIKVYDPNSPGPDPAHPYKELGGSRIVPTPSSMTTRAALLAVTVKLKTNSEYVVEAIGNQEVALTAGQRAALIAAIQTDAEISSLINGAAQSYLSNPQPMPSYTGLNTTQQRLNAVANSVVKKTDPNYQVRTLDPVAQLTDLTTFINDLVDALNYLDAIENNGTVTGNANKDAILTEIRNLRNQLKIINWGEVQVGDAAFIRLAAFTNAIFALIPAPGEILTRKKTELEAFIATILAHRDAWANTLMSGIIAANTISNALISTTYNLNFTENSRLYVTLDVGLAYAGNLDRFLAYSGVNIYFRPVNKNIPLRAYNNNWKSWLGVRTSLLVGITLTSIEKANVRKALVGNSALMLGLGFRFTPFLKLNGGAMLYYNYPQNPTFEQTRLSTGASPFISLSIDVDAKTLFSGIGEAIFK